MRHLQKIYFSSLFDIAWMSVVFMWLMPHGSFEMNKIGFYLSIIQAVFISITIRFLLKKYQKDYMGKVK